jgi:hypothetical protein
LPPWNINKMTIARESFSVPPHISSPK